MAVSGRITLLIDRLRHGRPAPVVEMTPEQMLAAIQAATSAEFGTEDETFGPEEVTLEAPVESGASVSFPSSGGSKVSLQFLFLGGVALGGLIAALLSGSLEPTWGLRSEGFSSLSGGVPLSATAILFGGGVLVGFGTRMAGGCTSGHGLCGMSRLQPGSLLATVSFFAAGIATSFGLGMFL
jgi:hypothetical protein